MSIETNYEKMLKTVKRITASYEIDGQRVDIDYKRKTIEVKGAGKLYSTGRVELNQDQCGVEFVSMYQGMLRNREKKLKSMEQLLDSAHLLPWKLEKTETSR